RPHSPRSITNCPGNAPRRAWPPSGSDSRNTKFPRASCRFSTTRAVIYMVRQPSTLLWHYRRFWAIERGRTRGRARTTPPTPPTKERGMSTAGSKAASLAWLIAIGAGIVGTLAGFYIPGIIGFLVGAGVLVGGGWAAVHMTQASTGKGILAF